MECKQRNQIGLKGFIMGCYENIKLAEVLTHYDQRAAL